MGIQIFGRYSLAQWPTWFFLPGQPRVNVDFRDVHIGEMALRFGNIIDAMPRPMPEWFIGVGDEKPDEIL